MKSARRFAIVALLTIAGSLLLTEARYPGEEYPSQSNHRHRHHRHEINSGSTSSISRKNNEHRLAMKQQSLKNEDEDDYEETYDIYDEEPKKLRRNRKISSEKEEDDEDEYDNEGYEDENEYSSDRYFPRRRNLRFGSARHLVRGHRTRPDSRLYHINDYPPRNHDFLTNEPDATMDETEDYEEYKRSSSSSRWNHRQYHPQQHRSRHQHPQYQPHYYYHHQPRRQQHHSNNRDNELVFTPRWKTSHPNIVPKTELKNPKYGISPRKKPKFTRTTYMNINYAPHQNITKFQERKWRNNNSRREEKFNKEIESPMVDEEEDDIWSEAIDDYDEEDDADDDNDDFDMKDYPEEMHDENRNQPPLRTYDEIIKRLTSNDPTTQQPLKTSVKRDYRNTEIGKFLKPDAFGNLQIDPQVKQQQPEYNRKSNDPNSIIIIKNITDKLEESPDVISNNTSSNRDKKFELFVGKNQNTSKSQTGIKSLEEHEFDNDEDNEGKKKELEVPDDDEEDDDNDARNDTMTTMEYMVNDNESETSAPVTTTTPTPPTTTQTPSTTKRPVITTTTQKFHDHRDSRLNNTTIGLTTTRTPIQWQTKDIKVSSQSKKNDAEYKEAYQHAIKVSREGSCQWPRARVIPVRDVYPSPSTTHIPHCAILHRCSDDTGCCRSEALTCVPKHTDRVELYFYTTSVGVGSVVEKLAFYNHTECECREKNNYGSASEKPTVNEQRQMVQTGSNQHQITFPTQNIRIPPQKKPCRCPSEFTPRITATGECQCKCFEKDQNCLHFRRGKGYLSIRDRACIQDEECAVPSCEFGEYMKRQGKCPKKKDKFDSIANYPNSMNFKFRS